MIRKLLASLVIVVCTPSIAVAAGVAGDGSGGFDQAERSATLRVSVRTADGGDAGREPVRTAGARRPVRYVVSPVPYDPEAPTVAFCPLTDGAEPEWGWAFLVTTIDTRTGLVVDQHTICVPFEDADTPTPPPAPAIPEPPTIVEIWNAAAIPAPEIFPPQPGDRRRHRFRDMAVGGRP